MQPVSTKPAFTKPFFDIDEEDEKTIFSFKNDGLLADCPTAQNGSGVRVCSMTNEIFFSQALWS